MRTSVFHHTGAIKKEMSHPLRKIGKMPLIGDGHQSGFYFFTKGQAGKGTFGKSPAHAGND